jgi:uncharacterized iron-regulated membrane protein
MKKIIALLTALAFTLSLGAAFAQDASKAPAAPDKKEEKTPMKKKHAKKHAKKKTVKKEEAAPAAPTTK